MKWSWPLIILLAVPLLFNVPLLETLRLKTFDRLVDVPNPTGYFTILNITEEYIDSQGGYPLPRKTLADIHIKLLQEGAIGVGWVMLFPHPDRLDGDTQFAQALSYSPSVIAMPEVPNGIYPKTHGTVIKGPDIELPKAQGFLQNIDILKDNSSQGVVSAPVDVDNLVRQIPLIQQTPDGWVASFGTEVLKILGGGNTYQIITNENGIEMIRVRGLEPIPTDSYGRKWISWVDTPQTTLDNLDVEGKFVFVGFTAKGISNQLATPVGLLEPHKIQAALAESILLDTPQIPDYRLFVELVLLCLSGFLIALVINYFGMTLSLLLSTSLFAGVASLGYYFISIGYLIDVTWSMISMTLLSLQQFYLRFRQQYRLRQQIKKQFEHYLDPRQVARLQKNPELLKLGGERKRCTIMFTDVRGFTSLSEKLEPEEVIKIMNKALTVQADAVQRNGGMVDKYIGDAMMAVWNAPLDVDNQEQLAIETALQIQHDMQEAELEVEIGIGINTGIVCVGNMGSASRFEYSCLGDAVNLAARLESSCKSVGKNLVIGEETIKNYQGQYTELDPIFVKGKEKEVKIYTI
jgi:adenylate cyclase|tara:strand:- start:1240 stop:2970 length:1731 start_codon:yes stop_codon:yes gene_type:complete